MDPYWSAEATMLWISLDRATAANGALCFLPGTQLEARREAAPIDEGFGDEGVGAMLQTRPEWQAIDPVRQHPHARSLPALQPQACCEASLRVRRSASRRSRGMPSSSTPWSPTLPELT